MNICLINPPYFKGFSRSQRSPAVIKSGTMYYPFWLASTAGTLEKRDFQVTLIDTPADKLTKETVFEKLKNLKPQMIVVDNNSTDRTVEIINKCREKYSNISIHKNLTRGISGSRKIGVEKAKNNYIAFTDADCIVPTNWLQTFLTGFDKYSTTDPHLVGVGGANIPPNTSSFYVALKIILNTFWGNHGSAQGKRFKQDIYIHHIPTVNVFYKKQAVIEVGNFDESFGNICEDVELNHRLVKKGYRLLFLKDSYVVHNMRSSFSLWCKNMFTYGKGRIWVIKKHPDHFRLMYLVPIIFLLALRLVPLGFINPYFAIAAAYFPIITGISLWETIKAKKFKIFPLVLMIYIITHLSYGIGEIYGIFTRRGN